MTVLSLIIPMYNSEQTIERTLQSVIEQTVQFMEVIVVDNGSDDQSSEIVERICNKHSFIRLVHCAQMGVSAARNMGIELATSEYISFLDADDTIVTNYVESIENAIITNQSDDIYHFNFNQQFKNGIIKRNPYFLREQNSYTGEQFRIETLKQFSFEAKHMVWTFVFRKEFLEKNHLQFNPELTIFEDIVFLHAVWNAPVKIYIIPQVLVQYCYYEKSLTNINETGALKQPILKFVECIAKQPDNDIQNYYFKLLSRVCSLKDYHYLLHRFYNQSMIKNVWSYGVNKVLYTYMKIRKPR
ncbi:MAG: glycosyltransferase family 2 protein [Culicoidibacterales bacterium]